MKKNKLLEMIKNGDLKSAVDSTPERLLDKNSKTWVDNKFFSVLQDQLETVEAKVAQLNEYGLLCSNGDIYVYLGRGGIKVEPTPKGVRKMLLYLSEKYGRSIVVSDGVLYKGDKVKIETDGLIDRIDIRRDTKTMVEGGEILAPYAVISILNKKDKLVAKKFIVMPSNEFNTAMKQAGNVKLSYPTMMAQKTVMKRALTAIYSLLGSALDQDDVEVIDSTIDSMNIESDADDQAGKIEYISEEDIKWIEDSIEGLDKTAFMGWLKRNRVEELNKISVGFFTDVKSAIEAAIKKQKEASIKKQESSNES